MNIVIVINQMFSILLIIGLGYVCAKADIIDKDKSTFLSDMIIKVFNPAIIFSSVLSNSQGGQNQYVGLTFLVAGISYGLVIILSKILAPHLTDIRKEQPLYEMMFIFSNLGFIGIPLVSSMFGTSCLIYVAIFILEYNIIFYVYMAIILSSQDGHGFHLSDLKAMINPGTISCLLTLLVFLTGIRLPDTISSTICSVGNVATPLALMVIGVTIGLQEDLLGRLCDLKLYIISLVKLILIPVFGILLMKKCHIPEIVGQISTIMLAMPVGTMPLIFAQEYHAGEEACSNNVIISTLLTLFTLPFIVFLYPHL